MEDGVIARSFFIAPDAEAILNIPLCHGGGDDFMAWSHEKSGVYIVKSAYRSLMNKKERSALEEGASSGSSNDGKELWNALWKLNVISKVRVFYWRVLRGIIPSECTLRHRHTNSEDAKFVCRWMEMESWLMLLSIVRMHNSSGKKPICYLTSNYQGCIPVRGHKIFYVTNNLQRGNG